MAGSNKDDKPTVVVGGIKKPNKSLKGIKWALTILISASLLFVGYKYYLNSQKTGNCAHKSNKACMVLKEAIPLLNNGDVKDLSKTVGKIQSIKNYSKDPNLLYVTVVYYIDLSDTKNASSNLDLLTKAYKSNVGYDPILGDSTQTPEQLKVNITALNNIQISNRANFWGVTSQGTTQQAGQ